MQCELGDKYRGFDCAICTMDTLLVWAGLWSLSTYSLRSAGGSLPSRLSRCGVLIVSLHCPELPRVEE